MHLFRLFLMLVHLLPLMAGEESSNDSNTDNKSDDKSDDVKFDEKQQAKVNDLLAAERKAAEDRTATRLRQEAETKAQRDKEQRERDEAEKRGEFDRVKSDLEGKLATAEGDLKAATTELDTLRDYVTKDIEAALKDDAFTPFKRFDPGKDAAIADRLKWLADAKAGVAEAPKPSAPGTRPNPPVRGADRIDEDAARAQARSRIHL